MEIEPLQEKAILINTLQKLNKEQKQLVRGLLASRNFSITALNGMIDFAGETEVLPVLVEAGFQTLSKKAQQLALRLTSSHSLTKKDAEEREQVKLLNWFNKGTHILRSCVKNTLLVKSQSV